jgi:hypothetical protein
VGAACGETVGDDMTDEDEEDEGEDDHSAGLALKSEGGDKGRIRAEAFADRRFRGRCEECYGEVPGGRW